MKQSLSSNIDLLSQHDQLTRRVAYISYLQTIEPLSWLSFLTVLYAFTLNALAPLTLLGGGRLSRGD